MMLLLPTMWRATIVGVIVGCATQKCGRRPAPRQTRGLDGDVSGAGDALFGSAAQHRPYLLSQLVEAERLGDEHGT